MISASLLLLVSLAGQSVAQPARDFGCTEWQHCRELALAAADRGDYETFHDLAWRAVQTGPPRDPALMYLLARAQALSGRPHDALIMLGRLAEMGVASDAATSADFVRTRQLPGWPELSVRIERLSHPTPSAVTPPPAASPSPPSIPPPSLPPAASSSPPSTPPPSLPPALEGSRFSIEGPTLSGFAYDTVSRRFLFGDRVGRKLVVVGEGANHAVDFVRADSAGFGEIAAFEIDGKRGDLWAVSGGLAGGVLHKLQLVSGRPLKSFQIAANLERTTLIDLAVTPAGAVLVLGSDGQLFVLHPQGTAVERVMSVDAGEPASLATAGDEGVAYIAYRDGLLRIDLRARTATRVTAPPSVSLAHLEQIRWRTHALFAIRANADGTRCIVRLAFNAGGRAVTRETTVDNPALPDGVRTLVAISGDDLVYVVEGARDADGRAMAGASSVARFTAFRVHLR